MLKYFIRHIAIVILLSFPFVGMAGAQTLVEQWNATAERAEQTLEADAASNPALEALRDELSVQRAEALQAQEEGVARAASLAMQLAGLGDPPADPETESPEIAAHRAELSDQLAAANVPVFEAQVAHQRATDLIDKLDSRIRARINQQLVTLGPTPLDPTAWPGAGAELLRYGSRLISEFTTGLENPVQYKMLIERLPFITILILVGVGLLFGVRPTLNRYLNAAIARATSQRHRFGWALLLSLSRIIVPALGAFTLIYAIKFSGAGGFFSETLIEALPQLAMILVSTYWLSKGLNNSRWSPIEAFVSPEGNAGKGQRVVIVLGLVFALHILLDVIAQKIMLPADYAAVLNFPLILIGSLYLYHASRLMKLAVTKAANQQDGEIGDGFNRTIMPILRRAVFAIAILAPILAAIGYFAAARFLLYPAILSLGLIGAANVAHGILSEAAEIWLSPPDDEDGKASNLRLMPVVIGFLMALAALPVLALIWGARVSDLTEIWVWMNEGVSLGDATISLSDVVTFSIVFAIGFTVTRLLQKLLRNSVLPRTRLDAGGRNAALSGVGYVGFTIAGLVAISATGIDLSNLAIVAGALSVGVGFGLQTIVSNFVSGIILLIERPIKEGDWIEVGSYSGYVRRIAVRSTEIENFDRGMVVIPNTDLIAGTVLNWTHSDLVGRVKVPVGVAYGSDPREVERILLEAAESHPMVLRNPSPSVVFHGFGADSMDFEVRAFLRDVNWQLSAKSDINFEIVKRFGEAGIEIPFAQRDVNLKNVSEITDALKAATKPDTS